MKRTRGLWASIIFVCVLVVASLVGFATGALKPTLGLDLEGGVSVILSAPDGTPREVMEQALSNIRNRVDAFGVGEPDIVLSGDTIEVQIPGLTKGSIEERKKTQYCLVGEDDTNYGCADTQEAAQTALDRARGRAADVRGMHRRPGERRRSARVLRDPRGSRSREGRDRRRAQGRGLTERIRRPQGQDAPTRSRRRLLFHRRDRDAVDAVSRRRRRPTPR